MTVQEEHTVPAGVRRGGGCTDVQVHSADVGATSAITVWVAKISNLDESCGVILHHRNKKHENEHKGTRACMCAHLKIVRGTESSQHIIEPT